MTMLIWLVDGTFFVGILCGKVLKIDEFTLVFYFGSPVSSLSEFCIVLTKDSHLRGSIFFVSLRIFLDRFFSAANLQPELF